MNDFKLHKSGWLEKTENFKIVKSPNIGKHIDPKFIVMHYTAGPSMESAIRTLADPKRKASAHFIIAKDGYITQLVKGDVAAWHAGRSVWGDYKRINLHSIGIELVNAGKLNVIDIPGATKFYQSWWGAPVHNVYLPEDYYIVAKAKGQKIHKTGGAFERYPQAQLESAMELCEFLRDQYIIEDILGHSDVAVPEGRKIDPGPAFPMEEFRAALFDRCDEEDYDEPSS